MNIFHKIALKGLVKNRTRTVVTVIGVVLSAALLTGVMTFGISLLDYMARGAAEKDGGWHVGFFDVPRAFVQERAQDADVLDAAAVQNLGYALLENSQNPEKPYFFVAGYDEKAFQAFPVYVISGRLPQNDREVVVSGGVKSAGGAELEIGSVLTLELGDRTGDGRTLGQRDRFDAEAETFSPRETREFTIVGFCQRPRYESQYAPGYTLLTRTADDGEAPNYSVFVTLANPYRVRSYSRETAGSYPYTLNDNVLRFLGLSSDRVFTTLLFAVGGVVVAIIMTGSVFLIHNAFQISLNERTHQLGILLSVGATARQLRGSVLFEGLCVGLLGIPPGVLLGLAVIRGIIAVVARSFQGVLYNTPLVTIVSAPAVAAAALVALVSILLSAYLPARKAAATPVLDCIRQTGEIRVEPKAVRVSRLAERFCGFEVVLALKNFKRNRRRYRSIVLSLTLSVVLFVSTSAFVTNLRQASEAAVVFTTFDVVLAAKNWEDGDLLRLYELLRDTEGVTESGYQEVRRFACSVPAEVCSDDLRAELGEADRYPLALDVQFLDEPAWRALLERAGADEQEFTGPDAPLLCIGKINNHVNRLLDPSEFVDSFTVPELETAVTAENGAEKTLRLRFVNIVGYDSPDVDSAGDETAYFFQAMAPWSAKASFDALGAPTRSKGITFRSDTPARTESAIRSVLAEAAPDTGYTLLNMTDMTRTNANMIFIANVFAYSFIIMISLIAAANVFNTISTNIRLRRRELAMLRSVGMSERGFQKMMNFECVFYGAQALAVGVPLSMALSYLIYRGMYIAGADAIQFHMPWAAIAVSIFSVLLLVFVTMLYAVRRIKKENIIDALRDDLA